MFKGKSLIVELSGDKPYGYKYVCKKDEDEKGPRFHAKKKLSGEPKPRRVPGSLQRSPVEAVEALAYFEAGYLGALKDKKQYKPRRRGEVSCAAVCCSLSHLLLASCVRLARSEGTFREHAWHVPG
eukprot:2746526-Prymnesium_polylepis.1